MAVVRQFDGVDDVVKVGALAGGYNGDFEFAVLFRLNNTGIEQTLTGFHVSSPGVYEINELRLGVDASDNLFLSTQVPVVTYGDRVTETSFALSAGTWYLAGVHYNALDVYFSLYDFDNATAWLDWQYTGTLANPPYASIPLSNGTGRIWFGGHSETIAWPAVNADPASVDIAAALLWDSSIGSLSVWSLAGEADQGAWDGYGPDHRWEFGQTSVATPVTDAIGSIDEIARTGTTVISDDPPISYATPSVDVTPPDTIIDSGPSDPDTDISPTWTFHADEPGCTFERRLDGGSWAAVTSPHTELGLAVGAHTFEVRATDPATNVDGTPAAWNWTITASPGPVKVDGVAVIQEAKVGFRHIGRGSASDPGAIQVLNDYWVPQRNLHGGKEGLEGNRGVLRGTYETKLGEEAGAELTLPNAAGKDGQLHRKRFEALSSDYPNYHAGDEYVEILRNGDVDYVGTPLRPRKAISEVGLQLADAWWLLKKVRETGAGFWCHAPRDVWEHYAGVWADVHSTDFRFGGQFTETPTFVATADGRWMQQRVAHYSDNDAVRLDAVRPNAGSAVPARLEAIPDNGYVIDPADKHWVFEVNFRRSLFGLGGSIPAAFRIGLVNRVSGIHRYYLEFTPSAITVWVLNAAGPMSKTVNVVPNPKAPHSTRIERRGDWVYFYFQQQIVSVMPCSDPGSPAEMRPFARLDPSDNVNRESVVIDSMICRKWHPWLARGAYRGELRLPDATAGGLIGEYFDDRAAWTEPGHQHMHLFKPTKEPVGRREDDIIDFYDPSGSPWTPHGQAEQFSTRWTGAVYLDLDNFDYFLRARADDRIRVWIGKTREAEEYLVDWTLAGHAMTTTTGGSLRTHLADSENPVPRSGWYPIKIEYSNGLGASGALVQIRRSGTGFGNSWVNLNGGTYLWEALSDSPGLMIPFDERETGAAFADRSTNAHALSGHALRAVIEGPIHGHLSGAFEGGTGGYSWITWPNHATVNPTNQLTLEMWLSPDNVTAGVRNVIRKENQYSVRQNGTTVEVLLFLNGAFRAFNFASAIVDREWHLYAATCFRSTAGGVFSASGTHWTVILYRDGQPIGTNTQAFAFNLGTSTNAITIGNFSSAEWYLGRMAYVAVYLTALSVTRHAAHWAARLVRGPSGRTAPDGIVKEHVRHESHYAMLERLVTDYGYQATLEPRALESGEFPGRLIPRLRVGRDTDYVVDEKSATGMVVDGNAEDIADHLIGDAAGLGTEDSGQISVEQVNYEGVAAHPFIHSEAESLPEISFEANLRRRLDSLMVLRSSPWEEVSTQPTEGQRLADTFPLTGALALFDWGAGDGIRYNLPSLDIVDDEPRQVTQAIRQFVQAGFGRPEISTRQNPRRTRDLIAKLQRISQAQHRNFQGQVIPIQGSVGVSGATDVYSRLYLPTTLGLQRLELIVISKSDASAKTIEVNGVNRTSITAVGPYDVTPYAAASATGGMEMSARLTGGTGSHTLMLRALFASP